jgi:hypothetical protein
MFVDEARARNGPHRKFVSDGTVLTVYHHPVTDCGFRRVGPAD